jgi:hypothetical protein
MSTHSAPAASRGAVIRADIVGHETGSRQATIDARWLMAYAAASGARHPRFFDTTVPGGPPAHPLFAVCYEWPLLVDLRAEVIGEAAA